MSYFSNILTATKSRYQSIRGESELDGDTEDDSNISRCLRAYYTEQGRPLPNWLGGGPPPVQSLRGTYGHPNNIPPPAGRGRGQPNANASLSDIWDKPGQQGQQFQNPRFGPQGQRQHIFPDEGAPPPPQQHAQDGAGKALTSAQQRIKERLWGGRTASPPPNQAQKPAHPHPHPHPVGVQMPGEHQFGGGPPPRSRSPVGRQGKPLVAAAMPWDDGGYSDGFDGAPGVPGYYGGGGSGGSASGGNSRKPAGGSGGRVGLPSGPGMFRQHRGGGY